MKSLFPIVFCFFLGSLNAQWQDNFADAVKVANEENKPIVLVFSGSDWCAPCIRFKKKILESEEFKNYAKANYVIYNADFPRKKKNQLPQDKLNANKTLAEKYNSTGYFPLVVLLDKKESVLGKTGFNTKTSPGEYISLVNDFIQ
nr:thioredoxin family protein [uncultured Allomuricauda sp.]